MLVDDAQAFRLSEPAGLDLGLVEAVPAQFRSRHPYLLFRQSEVRRIRQRANSNPKLMARLESALGAENSTPAEEELRTRIKRRSRRLIHLSFLALVGDGAKRATALQDARSVLAGLAAEATWKARPVISSFLDCSEIALAVSLAYDWLYRELPDRERGAIEGALLRHVLEPALAAYEDRFAVWPKRRDNCALVSNSGILISSLAVLGRYPELAIKLIAKSLASVWRIFEGLAPDGAWPEGLSYWSLAMRYASLMVAALESALDQSFGLADRPGFAQTGDFALHAVGPFGAAFNFGDSVPSFDISPLAWFAHRFKRPVDAQLIDQYDGWYLPFTAIWARRPKSRQKAAKLPTGKVFYSGDLACFRNTWSADPTARPVYLAIKGGNVFAPGATLKSGQEETIIHTQADAGSFIVDGATQRWIIDLGPDDYDLPGYFDHGADCTSGPRWQYYRTHAAGHNTLTIDGRNQLPCARVPIIDSCVEGPCKWAVLDLSAAYRRPPGTIRRGAALIGRQIVIQDEIAREISGTIVWTVHTAAEPLLVSGSVARFRLGGARMVLRILEPAAAQFEIGFLPEPRSFPIADVRQLHSRAGPSAASAWVCELPRRIDEDGKRAAGALIRRLQIVWPHGTRRLSVAVLPDCDEPDMALPVTPLNDWLARGPVRLASYPRPEFLTAARRTSTPPQCAVQAAL